MKKLGLLVLFVASTLAVFGQNMTVYVNADKGDCVSKTARKCLIVKFDSLEKWQPFYNDIIGFKHEDGNEYKLLVVKKKLKKEPFVQYTLKKVIYKKKIVPPPPVSISGKWRLVRLFQDSTELNLTANEGAYLLIDEVAKGVTGFGGCNQIFGDVGINGRNIVFDNLGATKKMCAEAAKVEYQFFNNLTATTTFALEQNILTLSRKGRILAILEKM